MNHNEIKKLVIDFLCQYFDKFGQDSWLSSDDISNKLSQKGVSKGEIDVALNRCKSENLIGSTMHAGERWYWVRLNTYESWLARKELAEKEKAGGEALDNPRWQPLSIENYEDLAVQADTLAEALEKDNGYNTEHYEEAKYTIEETKNFSTSLREGEGKVLRLRLDRIFEIFERLSVIFNKTTIIGKLVISIINLFKTLLP